MSEAPPRQRRRGTLTLLAGTVALVLLVAAVGAAAAWHHRRSRNEQRAIAALKTIATAQTIFREGDKDNDGRLAYATLEKLRAFELIDAELASGTKDGYVFRTAPSSTTDEFLWFATAEPELPGVSGRLYFCTNQSGEIVAATTGPFAMNTSDCTPPAR